MYDQLLGKDKIVAYFRDLGMSEDEVEKSWGNLIKSFTLYFLAFVYEAIPEEDRKVIDFGIDNKIDEGKQRLVDLTNKYLNEHPEKFDISVLGKKAAEQVIQALKGSINERINQKK